MAERRMFAKSIVQGSRFLKMPVSSRELYFQLGLSADDDGVVEAWNVMKITSAREDDLRVLVAKGYVQILDNEDLIAYLTDWETNNTIRKDRYHEGLYKELKLQVLEMAGNQLTTKLQPTDNQTTPEVSIGKDSIVKVNNIIPPKIEWIEDYCKERNNGIDASYFFDFYQSKNWFVGKNKMKDWQACVRTWERNQKEKEPKKEIQKSQYNFAEMKKFLTD